MMTRREALARGMPVLGIFRSFSAVGVDPAIMGIGPAVAIPDAVAKASRWLMHHALHICSSRNWDLSQVTDDGVKPDGEGVCTMQCSPGPACRVARQKLQDLGIGMAHGVHVRFSESLLSGWG